MNLLIRSRRKSLGLPLVMVAKKLGRDYSWLAKVERGRIPIDRAIAKKIMKAIEGIWRELDGAKVRFGHLQIPDRRGRRKTIPIPGQK